MNTITSPLQPVPSSSEDSSPPPIAASQPFPAASLLSRASIADHRTKSRPGAADNDPSKLATTIKRSQAISNIQDLDEDSPVTFEIDTSEHLHGRKKVQLQANPTYIGHRSINESLSSIDKQATNSSGGGDESDSRSECSEKMPEYLAEEKPILPGVHVKGATLNRLVRLLIDSFRKFARRFVPSQRSSTIESDGATADDKEFPHVFFLMHKWIMESEHLSHMLYDAYRRSGEDYKKATSPTDKQSCKDEQLHICQAFK